MPLNSEIIELDRMSLKLNSEMVEVQTDVSEIEFRNGRIWNGRRSNWMQKWSRLKLTSLKLTSEMVGIETDVTEIFSVRIYIHWLPNHPATRGWAGGWNPGHAGRAGVQTTARAHPTARQAIPEPPHGISYGLAWISYGIREKKFFAFPLHME